MCNYYKKLDNGVVMNKKRIAITRQQIQINEDKKDKRNSLLFCMLIVFGISFVCSFFLTPFYQWLGELSEAFSVDIEKKDTPLHLLCEIGANVFFYLTSFLGTVSFFIGAAYVCRFAYMGKRSKSAGASATIFCAMFAPTAIALVIFLFRKLGEQKGEYVRLADPMGIVFDILFLLFRVLVIAVVASKLSKSSERASAHRYAIFCAVFMLVCAVALEFWDTTLPFLLAGRVFAVDVLLMILSYGLYVIHAVVGYIVVRRFIEGRRTTKQIKQSA